MKNIEIKAKRVNIIGFIKFFLFISDCFEVSLFFLVFWTVLEVVIFLFFTFWLTF